jgi:hypothetical protein
MGIAKERITILNDNPVQQVGALLDAAVPAGP